MKGIKERKPFLPNAQREAPPVKLLLPKKRISLNDDDEDIPLMIDEKKSSSKSKPARIGNHNNHQRGPIKLRLSGNLFLYFINELSLILFARFQLVAVVNFS